LQRIAKIDVDKNDRPLEPVLVARCGELEKRKKPAPQPQATLSAGSTDRGRRRKSDASDEEMEDTPEPQAPRLQRRRQSDNVVDEGLRGRPRQRSGSRSVSQALPVPEEQTEPETVEQHSPVKKHKRKREPSPSRPLKDAMPQQEHDDYQRRRRPSLPNQYSEEKHNGLRGDDDRYKPSPRRADHRYAGQRRDGEYRHQREDDRYRPSRDRDQDEHQGRLSSNGRLADGYDDHGPPVKFKGRGVMKYREPGRL